MIAKNKWWWLLFGFVAFIPNYTFAQSVSESNPQSVTSIEVPEKGFRIVAFRITAKGLLRISYSNGTAEEIPKGKRESPFDGEGALTQEGFADIHLSDDHQYIGWLPEYMLCTQSYPCTPELIIYRPGSRPRPIVPPYGVMWAWKFLKGSKQIVAHYGFTHGEDEGAYGLYDIESGHEVEKFSAEDKTIPKWVRELRAFEPAK